MVSLETVQATLTPDEPISGPRISFSTDFPNTKDFISRTPNPCAETELEMELEKERNVQFEFLSSSLANQTILTADELFCEGKLLPFWNQAETLNKMTIKTENAEGEEKLEVNNEENRVNWFIDDDPSPRPPKCTVLWKELLRLKKQRASALSPSSSSSSSSSSSLDMTHLDERKERSGNRQKYVKTTKKGLERTRSETIRIRPLINLPICTQGKNGAAAFSLKKGRLER